MNQIVAGRPAPFPSCLGRVSIWGRTGSPKPSVRSALKIPIVIFSTRITAGSKRVPGVETAAKFNRRKVSPANRKAYPRDGRSIRGRL